MDTYILIFRMDIQAPPTPELLQGYIEQWQQWVGSLGNRLQSGNHLSVEGRLLKPNNHIEPEPYSVNRESVAGYFLVSAKDFDDAEQMAHKCPILQGEGTSVEIRKIASQ